MVSKNSTRWSVWQSRVNKGAGERDKRGLSGPVPSFLLCQRQGNIGSFNEMSNMLG